MLRTLAGRPPRSRPSVLTARRLVAVLAVPALLFTAACGSDEEPAADAKIDVTGKFGDKPKISTEDGKSPSKLSVDAVIPGRGRAVQEGDYVRLDFSGKVLKDGQSLGGTWETAEKMQSKGPRRQLVHQMGQPNQELPETVLNAVLDQKVGSRLEITGTAKSVVGDQLNPQSGLEPEDGLVFIIDVVGAQKADVKTVAKGDQAEGEDGLPEVAFDEKKGPSITVPKGEKAPTSLKEQVLVKGKGPKVAAGEGIIAHYQGVKWEDGKQFDSSWERKMPTAFQIGTGSVVKGWDQALDGKRIGDRVELVIPPKLAYADQPEHELSKYTLVFVVDIVGKV